MGMTVAQLINILREMDKDADVCLAVDVFNKQEQEWESELIFLNVDDLILGSSYAAFQVPEK